MKDAAVKEVDEADKPSTAGAKPEGGTGTTAGEAPDGEYAARMTDPADAADGSGSEGADGANAAPVPSEAETPAQDLATNASPDDADSADQDPANQGERDGDAESRESVGRGGGAGSAAANSSKSDDTSAAGGKKASETSASSTEPGDTSADRKKADDKSASSDKASDTSDGKDGTERHAGAKVTSDSSVDGDATDVARGDAGARTEHGPRDGASGDVRRGSRDVVSDGVRDEDKHGDAVLGKDRDGERAQERKRVVGVVYEPDESPDGFPAEYGDIVIGESDGSSEHQSTAETDTSGSVAELAAIEAAIRADAARASARAAAAARAFEAGDSAAADDDQDLPADTAKKQTMKRGGKIPAVGPNRSEEASATSGPATAPATPGAADSPAGEVGTADESSASTAGHTEQKDGSADGTGSSSGAVVPPGTAANASVGVVAGAGKGSATGGESNSTDTADGRDKADSGNASTAKTSPAATPSAKPSAGTAAADTVRAGTAAAGAVSTGTAAAGTVGTGSAAGTVGTGTAAAGKAQTGDSAGDKASTGTKASGGSATAKAAGRRDGKSDGARADANKAGAEQAGDSPSTAKQTGSAAGRGKDDAQQTRSNQAGTNPAGSNQADSNQADSKQAATKKAHSKQTGTNQPGTNQQDTNRPGTKQASKQTGPNQAGANKAEVEQTGGGDADVKQADGDQTGVGATTSSGPDDAKKDAVRRADATTADADNDGAKKAAATNDGATNDGATNDGQSGAETDGTSDSRSAGAKKTGSGPGGKQSGSASGDADSAEQTVSEQAAIALITALMRLRGALASSKLPLDVVGADEARQQQKSMLDQLDDYILPRLVQLEAPVLAVVGGSTGAGKSTLVNTLVGRVVSEPGVLRPTTRSPVLVHNPLDAEWFTGERVLPGLARSTGGTPGGAEDPGSIRLVAADTIPQGMAILDAPDIDSVVEANRELASQLLAAADLWLFVTTASRYADAVPWDFLKDAAERSTAVAVVLDRVPGDSMEDVTGHLAQMLLERGLGDSPLFGVPEIETGDDGLLTEEVVAPIKDWLNDLAADAEARASVVRRTLQGAVTAMTKKTPAFAAAVRAQADTLVELRANAETAYDRAGKDVAKAIQDGTMLRGEVLARWQEFVGTGELLKGLQTNVGRLRDKLRNAVSGKVQPTRDLNVAVESGLEALLREHAEAAAERAEESWQSTVAGRQLLATGQRDLGRSSREFSAAASLAIRDWQGYVLELVRREGADKRSTARVLAYGVNGLGLALMIVIFASTGGLIGAEVGVAGGTAVVGQKVLEAVFGDQAVRTLAAKARDDLNGRVHALMDAELARYLTVLDQHPVDPDAPRRLTEAARAVEDCT